jgi:hypothetical protein
LAKFKNYYPRTQSNLLLTWNLIGRILEHGKLWRGGSEDSDSSSRIVGVNCSKWDLPERADTPGKVFGRGTYIVVQQFRTKNWFSFWARYSYDMRDCCLELLNSGPVPEIWRECFSAMSLP